ncbi:MULTISPECIES: sugar phosphate isomerase/epimerase family protein [Dictyoglomus]|jgi:sugar phosphate isomerase/epimerase|uniref:Xylose isomerase domain protein TIM barrel n=1 Tax=Dictyoglomus turgidum (strain DSM 6724 / Z-1310) TaxID=515635 RepID=B8E1U3_DICTD|nr:MULTISPECIES: TIM barrel protein [Dictyoglomus]ACK41726.1 Xylose isomerase domain protein TIM barrel [Dictyoglomus turgidum DSM 6724]PNV79603.1 MAG: sugar phosphate isomerase/epimerase [Dictyoglomus turgidum]HBU31778.1 sugar phosphate isomerase/epimerase [Dictyoglomus sp.]
MKVHIDIGINGAFLTRRWEDPENFIKLTKELGYDYHSFCSDVLDPFFSGDKIYQIETAKKIREYAEKYNVKIWDYYTGMATHRFHGLSHSDERVRQRMKEWIISAMDIVKEMGAKYLGGHWDALSVEVLQDPEKTRERIKYVYETFKELAKIAKEKGLLGISNEQMYIPSEKPWTLQEAEEFLIEVNKKNDGVPIYITIDVGHQAGMHYGLSGEDLSYEEWLKRFAVFSPIIHLQQTTRDASAHWPFTEEYNAIGHVKIEKVLSAIEYSFKHYKESPISQYLKPVEEIILIAEIIPSSTKTEEKLLKELKETAEYLRNYIPKGGIYYEF